MEWTGIRLCVRRCRLDTCNKLAIVFESDGDKIRRCRDEGGMDG